MDGVLRIVSVQKVTGCPAVMGSSINVIYQCQEKRNIMLAIIEGQFNSMLHHSLLTTVVMYVNSYSWESSRLLSTVKRKAHQ